MILSYKMHYIYIRNSFIKVEVRHTESGLRKLFEDKDTDTEEGFQEEECRATQSVVEEERL